MSMGNKIAESYYINDITEKSFERIKRRIKKQIDTILNNNYTLFWQSLKEFLSLDKSY